MFSQTDSSIVTNKNTQFSGIRSANAWPSGYGPSGLYIALKGEIPAGKVPIVYFFCGGLGSSRAASTSTGGIFYAKIWESSCATWAAYIASETQELGAKVYGTSATSSVYSAYYDSNTGGGFTQTLDTSIGVPYFILSTNPPTQENFINIIYPVASSTIPDIQNFIISYALASTTEGAFYSICYNSAWNGSLYSGCRDIGGGNSASSSFILPKYVPNGAGKMTATAQINDLNSYENYVIATSAPVSWASTGILGESFYGEPTTTTSTVSVSSMDCTGSGFVADSFCSVLKFLFTPTQASMERWSGLMDTISKKPPIGYFYNFKNELASLGIVASSSYTITDISGITFFDTIKLIVSLLLYFITIFYVFRRLKHAKI